MKKIVSCLMAVITLLCLAPTALATTTTLTTTVPVATYTLNIPADQKITFGTYNTKIGNITVTDGKNFAQHKNVEVTINYTPFTSENTSTTIPYVLEGFGVLNSSENTMSSTKFSNNGKVTFKGLASGGVQEKAYINCSYSGKTYSLPMDYISVIVESSDWGKAAAGNYSSVISFTSEIVIDE